MADPHGFVPIPDPTKLTTDAVAAVKAEIIALFDAKHKALGDLIEEKFKGRDAALAAALKAAQEITTQQNASNSLAADKAERAFVEQIKALTVRFDDLKEQMAKLDRKDWSTVGAYLVGAIGIISTISAIILTHR